MWSARRKAQRSSTRRRAIRRAADAEPGGRRQHRVGLHPTAQRRKLVDQNRRCCCHSTAAAGARAAPATAHCVMFPAPKSPGCGNRISLEVLGARAATARCHARARKPSTSASRSTPRGSASPGGIDAGTVIVADVYAGRREPDRGRGPRCAGRGVARARASQRGAAAGARAPRRNDPRHRAAGRFRGVPGRRNITQWAAALPGQLAALQADQPRTGGRHDGGSGHSASGRPASRRCAGGCRPMRVLAPPTWFRVGGPAEVLVRPADAGRSVRLPAGAAA